jgi:PIN domain nuclease of toxin-antitoxin system
VRLLLDTAVLIYAVDSPDRISKRAMSNLENSENILEMSSISLAEIAIKAAAHKLDFTEDDVRHALDDLGIRILPYGGTHALRLFGLPRHHRDPFDRQLIAQALYEEIPIVTPDEAFGLYKGLRIIW